MTPSTHIDHDTVPTPFVVNRRHVRLQVKLRGSTAHTTQHLRGSGISSFTNDGKQVAGPPNNPSTGAAR